MISDQVKELREYAEYHFGEAARLTEKAADTIEFLSDKMRAANIDRSAADYGGGWIPCKERLPEEKGWYLVYAKNQRPFVAYFKGKTFPLNNHYHEIIAWMSLPEAYHEP